MESGSYSCPFFSAPCSRSATPATAARPPDLQSRARDHTLTAALVLFCAAAMGFVVRQRFAGRDCMSAPSPTSKAGSEISVPRRVTKDS